MFGIKCVGLYWTISSTQWTCEISMIYLTGKKAWATTMPKLVSKDDGHRTDSKGWLN